MTKHVTSYGIIPTSKDLTGANLYLLVESVNGYWGFPKGHREPGESIQQVVIREASEEIGMQISPEELKFQVSYGYKEEGKNGKQKTVILYPVVTQQEDVSIQAKELKSYRWVKGNEVVRLINLPGVEEMMEQVSNFRSRNS